MRHRIRKLANGEYIAEAKRLFFWRIICVAYPTFGDLLTKGDVCDSDENGYGEYQIEDSSNYEHAISIRFGSHKTLIDARDYIYRHASKRGLGANDISIEVKKTEKNND